MLVSIEQTSTQQSGASVVVMNKVTSGCGCGCCAFFPPKRIDFTVLKGVELLQPVSSTPTDKPQKVGYTVKIRHIQALTLLV